MVLKLELKNEKGQKIVYEQDFVSARKTRQAFELLDKFDIEILEEAKKLDATVEFVASVFDDKEVTSEAIYDGLDAHTTMKELNRVISWITGNDEKKSLDEK